MADSGIQTSTNPIKTSPMIRPQPHLFFGLPKIFIIHLIQNDLASFPSFTNHTRNVCKKKEKQIGFGPASHFVLRFKN
jgi:hypothetical protein